MVSEHAARPEVTVVIATHDRVDELCATLARLTALPDRPDIIVVDNASLDRTAVTVRDRFRPWRPARFRGSLPGPRVLGFLGCAAVARRTAFLAAGGYSPIPGIGAEEQLLALDLAAKGWACAYRADVVAWRQPSLAREAAGRGYLLTRDQAVMAWLRRPLGRAVLATLALVRAASLERATSHALAGLTLAMPEVLAARRRLPPQTERYLVLIEHRAQAAARPARRILTRAGHPRAAAVPIELPAARSARRRDTSARPA